MPSQASSLKMEKLEKVPASRSAPGGLGGLAGLAGLLAPEIGLAGPLAHKGFREDFVNKWRGPSDCTEGEPCHADERKLEKRKFRVESRREDVGASRVVADEREGTLVNRSRRFNVKEASGSGRFNVNQSGARGLRDVSVVSTGAAPALIPVGEASRASSLQQMCESTRMAMALLKALGIAEHAQGAPPEGLEQARSAACQKQALLHLLEARREELHAENALLREHKESISAALAAWEVGKQRS